MKHSASAIILLLLILLSFSSPLSTSGVAQAADFAPEASLIRNGGFEQGLAGWYQGGCVACSSISTTVVYRGVQSYLVDTTAASTGSFIWQPVPELSGDFELRVFVFAKEGANVVELVRDWDPLTGVAQFVTQVFFADPATGTVRLQAWDTKVYTDLVWPSHSWHELKIVAHWLEKKQDFFVDDRLFATVHASTVFLPTHIIVGDVRGLGWQSRYLYDAVRLRVRPAPPTNSVFLPLILGDHCRH